MELAPRFLRPVLRPVERLVDALTDPARRERTVLVVLAAYAAIWTLYGVLSKAVQGVQSDTAELVAWSHHLELGYAKHPPLAAWLMHAWFMLFPIRDWSCYLLAMVYAALGLWIAWRLFERFLDPDKRVVALACLMRWCRTSIFSACVSIITRCSARFGRRPRCASSARFRDAERRLVGCRRRRSRRGDARQILVDLPARGSCRGGASPTRGARAISARPRPGSRSAWARIVARAARCLAGDARFHSADLCGRSAAQKRQRWFIAAAGYLAGGIGYAAVPVLLVLALTRPSGAAWADMLMPRTPERRFTAVAFLDDVVCCRPLWQLCWAMDSIRYGPCRISCFCRWCCCHRRRSS